jgi:hypothetical protein
MEMFKVEQETGEIISMPTGNPKAAQSNFTNLFDAANGAINERIAYELPKIIDNLLDPNTDPTKVRTLTIKVNFKCDKSRTVFTTETKVEPKLIPTDSIPMQFTLFGCGKDATLLEITTQVPGQQDIHGNVQEEPKTIKTIR